MDKKKKSHRSQRLVNFHNNYMTSILKTPPIQRSEKKVQVNDNHRSTSGQIAFPPLPIIRDTQTALSPPPLSPSALDAWSGIEDRSPLTLWSPWGYHNISRVSVSLLCCLNSSCSCVSLSDRRWIMELNAK